jgi:hypothetical protein
MINNNIDILINESDQYIEEFGTLTKPGVTANIKLALSFIPIYTGYNVYKELSSSNMSFLKKLIISTFANIPGLSSFILMFAMIRNTIETMDATSIPYQFFTKIAVFTSNIIKSDKEGAGKLKDNDASYLKNFERLKEKYPVVNDLNNIDAAKEFGALGIEFMESQINILNTVFKPQMSPVQLNEFKDIQAQFKTFKTNFNKKIWDYKKN